ncbi:hypothetical protein [Clostridioides difficile]|nr:hypothetical protein [Clostridioides difficile]
MKSVLCGGVTSVGPEFVRGGSSAASDVENIPIQMYCIIIFISKTH